MIYYKFKIIYNSFNLCLFLIFTATAKKPRMLVQKIYLPSQNQDNQEKGNSDILKDKNIRIENRNQNIFTNISDLEQPLKLLQGITMIPMDDSTLVENAMESGQTVVLTGMSYLFKIIHWINNIKLI